jgi:soluble lytic murein transglycosylase-like protein
MKMKKIIAFTLGILLFLGFSRLEEVSSKFSDRAVELFRQGRYEQVVRLSVWNKWFRNEDVASLRIISLLKLKRGLEAEREILSFHRDSSPFILDHIYYLYLEYLAQERETSKILPWLKKLENDFPASPLLPQAYLLGAKALLGENLFSETIPVITKTLEFSLSPEEKRETLFTLSRAILKLGHIQEALWLFRKTYRDYSQWAFEIKSLLQPVVTNITLQGLSPEASVSLLEFLSTLSFHDEVETLIAQTEDHTFPPPLQERLFILRAKSALRSGDLEKLERLIRQTKEPKREGILFYQGVLEQRRGRYSQAIQNYEKLLQLSPQGEYVFQAYQNIASCYLAWGKEREYVDTLKKMTALFPQEASPWWELFRFFYRRNRFSEAKELMKQLTEVNREERNRALFWLYKLGDPSEKQIYLREILKSKDIDYYYVRAWQELKKLEPHSLAIPFRDGRPELSMDETILSSDCWRRYRFLQDIHLWENAEIELLALHRSNPSLYLYLELSYFYERKGDYRKSILYALYLRNRLHNDYPESFRKIEERLYPRHFLELVKQLPSTQKFDPYLFLALVKAESSFQVDAVSSAGAVGLVQVLPSTALWVIEKGWVDLNGEKVPSADNASALTPFLIRPEVNLSIGAAYFAYLLERFQGNAYLAICAYNAGPGRVSQWMEELPRDPDAFVEYIPFRETQNYLRRVVTNYFFYSLLYRGDFR